MAKGGKAPDNSAQIAELEKQKVAAEENSNRIADKNLQNVNDTRRQKRGKGMLIATGEFGTATDKLGK